jgi:RNA polymerase sigma-70 factor (ECF subfamily)
MTIAIHSDQESGETLVKRASKGDLEAFNSLVLYYQQMVYNHAYALTGDPDIADDITQESFIKAFRSLYGYRGGSFRAWLLKITTNTFYDQLRKSKKDPKLSLYQTGPDGDETDSQNWLIDTTTSIQTTVEHNDDMKRLYNLINELPAEYRCTITLIDLFETDYKEASQILKVPIGTIKSRLARARFQIRTRLLEDRF